MSCGNSRSSKCNPCGPSADAMNSIADRAAYYARIAVDAANSACFQLEDGGNQRWAYIGDGIQTIFDIPGAGTTISASYIVAVNGLLKDPADYTIISGNPYRLATTAFIVPNGQEIVIVSIKGIIGSTGATGVIGLTGSTGLTGLTGATGIQGTPGGATGATGIQGISGTAAAGGQDWVYVGNGILNTFALNGANSLIPAGYLVSIDGVVQDPNNYSIAPQSPYDLVLSSPVPSGSTIVIVEIVGPIGATGATGPQGPQGTPGGATGATGLPSPAGGIRWAYTSDGFSTIYAISGAFSTLNTAYLVTYNGVTQDPANYTITAGSPYSITLSTSPAAGVGIVIVSLNGIQGATGPQGTPGGATGATGPVGPAVPSGGIRWAYTGNGSQTVFNITGASTTLSTAYLVSVDGVTQDPNNYTITAGSPYTLTISTVPSGSVIVITSLSIGLANWITGIGNPNGVVTAPVGSIYTNLAGSSFSTLYVKESGSGNTGWASK